MLSEPSRYSGRAMFLHYLEQWIGTPYRWGGDDPLGGFDCSGYVIAGLRAVGMLPKGDWTAQGLLGQLGAEPIAPGKWRPGMVAFFGETDKAITHVEALWGMSNQTWLTIGADGGGSKTLTLADAIAQNAYVQVRPIRSDWRVVVDPFKGLS